MNRRARTAGESPGTSIGRWILPALLLSLLLHGLLVLWARRLPVESLSDEFYERIVPRTFHVERVQIDPKLLQEEQPKQDRSTAPAQVRLPEEKLTFDQPATETVATPAAPKIDATTLASDPTVAGPSIEETLKAAQTSGARTVLPEDKSLVEDLLQKQPFTPGTAVLDVPSPGAMKVSENPSGNADTGSGTGGFSDLDTLLTQTGPLSPDTAPILMPTDLLFDYNAFELRPGAQASLEKLGRLMLKNPDARFRIEGHTDSFGPDAFNDDLSLRRANAVKAFLTERLGVPADRIQTLGFGRRKLIAPSTASIEGQQINRRVEIVILAPQ